MPTRLELIALETLPSVRPGDDLAELVCAACARERTALRDGDVIVVAQKIVSKSEGRIVALAGVEPSPRALEIARQCGKDGRLVELILSESSEIVRCVPGLIITRHRLGVVLANAGVDQSNTGSPGEETAVLWPLDPDASAARLRLGLARRTGVDVAVIINDSLGRAWRNGTIGTAIGLAGVAGVVDRRGERDLFGRELRSTLVAQADELAAAASLLMGQGAEGRPVVVALGLGFDMRSASAQEMIREPKLDLFR